MTGSKRTTGRTATLALIPAAFAACAAEGPGSTVTVRDSAGVAIVESTAPAWAAGDGWTVEPEPVLDLAATGRGDPHEFFDVTDALRRSDGSFVVALGRSGEIRFFSAAGDHLHTLGRRGEGPGEFLQLASLEQWAGDSILAFDPRAQRATVVSPEPALSRVIGFEPALPWVLRTLGGVGLVALERSLDSELVVRQQHGRRPWPVVRLTPMGEVIDTVTTTPSGELVVLVEGAIDARALFPKDSYLVADADRFYLGSSDEMEFAVYGANGALERVIRVPGYDVSLSVEAVEAERAIRLGPDPTPREREMGARIPALATRPAYGDVLLDSEGYLWAAEQNGWFMNRLGAEPRDWEVFDPEGAWLGTVRMPARFMAFEIGPDYVLGLTRDEIDVERVQLLRLRR